MSLRDRLSPCVLCPRQCRVDRLSGETGYCGIGSDPVIAAAHPHFGEEPPLVGRGGSGTIFFSGCNLGCVFCQNYEISHGREGHPVTVERLAAIMLDLEACGCHNVNWVTPTHQIPAIVEALNLARRGGLAVPTVYNCGGYESVEILRLLEGTVQIYMPDAKHFSPDSARRYSDAPDYPEVMKAALVEMQRQTGDLEIRDGIAVRGLLVRHLVMPNGVEESIAILDFLAEHVSPRAYVNVMDQYRPVGRARNYAAINRRTAPAEHRRVVEHARRLGLRLCGEPERA